MLIEHVATSRAKTGGTCPECSMPIGVGNSIFKWTPDWEMPSGKNGPGLWICQWCHERLMRPATMEDETRLDIEPFICELCHQEANPVVVRCGKVRCIGCDRELP